MAEDSRCDETKPILAYRVTVDTSRYHNFGATAAQDIAMAGATVEYLAGDGQWRDCRSRRGGADSICA